MSTLYALYRYFDATGRLLYIGISGDLAVRDTSHISRSRWMELTASSTVERYGTFEAVKRAEQEAVESECPLFNVQYNDTPEARERLRVYLEEIGRDDLITTKIRKTPAVKPERKRKPRAPVARVTPWEPHEPSDAEMRAYEDQVALMERNYVASIDRMRAQGITVNAVGHTADQT